VIIELVDFENDGELGSSEEEFLERLAHTRSITHSSIKRSSDDTNIIG
jgi:hypothetical protein